MKDLIIFLFLLPIVSFGQNTLPSGQGILKVELEKLPTILFYTDTLKTKSSKSISIIKFGEFALKNERDVKTWLKPEQLYLEYDIFILRVDTIIGKWIKVYVDNEKAVKLWTRMDNYIKYFSWDNFFRTEVSNITKGTKELGIKESDNEGSKTIKKMEEEDCFEILDVRADWLKIRTHSILECSTSKRPIKSGWLKWQQKGKLTIKFGLTD